MNLFNFPIKRPVTVLMGMLMVLTVGYVSWTKMPLDLMPEISFPNLMVMVVYDGAGPEEIEERLAKPLEAAIKTTANIKNVKVAAQQDMALINAEFNWGTDLDSAAADLREKISMVRDVLPDDIEEPIVLQIDLQEMPVIFLHIDDPSGRRNLADLNDIASDQVTPMLERLPGVASATSMGGLTREIQVNLDQDKLIRYGLGQSDVVNAIRYRNMDKTVGDLDSAGVNFRIIGESQFKSIEEIGNIVAGNGMTGAERQQGALVTTLTSAALIPPDPLAGTGARSPIRLSDVAEIRDDFKEKAGMVRIILFGEEPSEGVGIAVMKETDANMVEVADTVKKALDGINETLPAGVKVAVSFDLSSIITDTLNALGRSAVEGAVLAALVIFVFLWGWRPSFVVFLSIPLSILVAFVAMFLMDYTLNLMTLGGMVIAIGKLVDDSIVVLENIDRHLDMGKSPFQAAEDGMREVATAVLSATLVAVIIFLPVAFTEGLSAQLFSSFAATIFFALMGSLLVAFTVVPMLSSRLLRKDDEAELKAMKGPRGVSRRFFYRLKHGHDRVWNGISSVYRVVLTAAVDQWYMTLVLAALLMALTAAMAVRIEREFIPRLVGGIYETSVKLPRGAVLEETDRIMTRVQERFMELPDYHHFFMILGQSGDRQRAAFTGGEQGSNQATFMTMMNKEAEGRTTSDEKLREMWDRFAAEHPAVEVNFRQAGSIDFSSQKPIQIKVFGDDFEVLRGISDRIAENIKDVAAIRDVTTTLQEGVPEYRFTFDEDKLSAYGMPSALALTEAAAAVGGEMAHLYREAGKEYDITVRLRENQRDSFEAIKNVELLSPIGFHFPLRDVAEFEFGAGPNKIERENSKRIVRVEANKTDDRKLSEIVADIAPVLDGIKTPEGYSIEFGGEEEDRQEAFADLGLMFVAAILLVYMILASLYESVIHPVTIMVAVPLAFTGAVAGLFIFDVAFGVTAFIGLIMLVGIVATNSIVLMDFIIEYDREGMDRRTAIIEAGTARLRPILMTAMTTMFGVLPIAIGAAEGMELMQPMGIVMVGGLISSTLLTLVVIPVFYRIFDDFAIDMKNIFRGKSAAAAPAGKETPEKRPREKGTEDEPEK